MPSLESELEDSTLAPHFSGLIAFTFFGLGGLIASAQDTINSANLANNSFLRPLLSEYHCLQSNMSSPVTHWIKPTLPTILAGTDYLPIPSTDLLFIGVSRWFQLTGRRR